MIKFFEEFKNKKIKETQRRVLELRYYITKFFEDLQKTKGTVELPAWVECKNLMEKLQINNKNPRIVNYYYKKLQKYKLANNL